MSTTRWLRWALFGFGTAAGLVLACGSSSGGGGNDAGAQGDGTGSSSGSGSSSGGAVEAGIPCTGSCCDMESTTAEVDLTECVPQVAYSSTCNGTLCTYTLIVPCGGDAGGREAGARDAGADAAAECASWCQQAAPAGFVGPSTAVCAPVFVDGGPVTMVSCGACGA